MSTGRKLPEKSPSALTSSRVNPLRDVEGSAPLTAPFHVSTLETEKQFMQITPEFPFEALLVASPVFWRIHPQQLAR